MNPSFKENFLYFVLAFFIFSIPIFFMTEKPVTHTGPLKAQLLWPQSSRALASTSSFVVANKSCEQAQKWRWSCKGKEGNWACRKDQQQNYQICKTQ